MDNKSAVDMSLTFKDTKNSRHIRRRFHFVKQGTEEKWHSLTWISNEFMLADVMTKILQKAVMVPVEVVHEGKLCRVKCVCFKRGDRQLEQGLGRILNMLWKL